MTSSAALLVRAHRHLLRRTSSSLPRRAFGSSSPNSTHPFAGSLPPHPHAIRNRPAERIATSAFYAQHRPLDPDISSKSPTMDAFFGSFGGMMAEVQVVMMTDAGEDDDSVDAQFLPSSDQAEELQDLISRIVLRDVSATPANDDASTQRPATMDVEADTIPGSMFSPVAHMVLQHHAPRVRRLLQRPPLKRQLESGEDKQAVDNVVALLAPWERAGIWATSTLRKRRVKMNKHKYKKLRRRTQALRKKLGK